MKRADFKLTGGLFFPFLLTIFLCSSVIFEGKAQEHSKFSVKGYTWGMTMEQVKKMTQAQLISEEEDELYYTYVTFSNVKFKFKYGQLYYINFSNTFYKEKKKAIADYNNKKANLLSEFGPQNSEKPGYGKELPSLTWIQDSTDITLSQLSETTNYLTYENKRNVFPVISKESAISKAPVVPTELKPGFGNLTIYTTSDYLSDIRIHIKLVLSMDELQDHLNKIVAGEPSIYGDNNGHYAKLNGTIDYVLNDCLPANDSYDGTNGNDNQPIKPFLLDGIKGLAVGPFAGENWNNSQLDLKGGKYYSINLPYGTYEVSFSKFTSTYNRYESVYGSEKIIINKGCTIIPLTKQQ